MNQQKEKVNRSEQQAESQLESIKTMVEALDEASSGKQYTVEDCPNKPCGDECDHFTPPSETAREEAEQTIQEDPLSVEVRSGWYSPGSEAKEDHVPAEYNVLLCTGGPACRIIGNLNKYGEPETARIEHQDWGTPWTEYRITGEDEQIVLRYVSCFYFGG